MGKVKVTDDADTSYMTNPKKMFTTISSIRSVYKNAVQKNDTPYKKELTEFTNSIVSECEAKLWIPQSTEEGIMVENATNSISVYEQGVNYKNSLESTFNSLKTVDMMPRMTEEQFVFWVNFFSTQSPTTIVKMGYYNFLFTSSALQAEIEMRQANRNKIFFQNLDNPEDWVKKLNEFKPMLLDRAISYLGPDDKKLIFQYLNEEQYKEMIEKFLYIQRYGKIVPKE